MLNSSQSIFSIQFKPKLVVLTLSPRNFIDTNCPLNNSDQPFKSFLGSNQYTNNFSPLTWDNPYQPIAPGTLVINASDGYVSQDNLEEYRRRYKNPSLEQFSNQMHNLDILMSYLADNKIKIVVFDLPLASANRKLLPASFWQSYNLRISQLCKKYGANRINIDEDIKAFKDNEFIDGIHLNLPGGLRLTTTIALYTANQFHLKTFEQLVSNEYKML
jgi:hypothetical protein